MSFSGIFNDILESGTKRQLAENQFFNSFSYFIKEGAKKYNSLQLEDLQSCYCDAVLAAIDNIRNKKYEGSANIKTYLWQIFSNKCVDVLRKNSTNKSEVNKVLDLAALDLPIQSDVHNALQLLVAQGEYEVLLQRLEELGEPCKGILLSYGDGYSYKEIAEMKGYKSPEVARTQLGRCRDKIINP